MDAHPPPKTEGIQVRYDIMSPEGGLGDLINEYAREQRHFLDLQISAGRGHLRTLRVFPNRVTVMEDPNRKGNWAIWGADCGQLTADEEVGELRRCTLRFNTQVTHKGLETGKIDILFKSIEEKL